MDKAGLWALIQDEASAVNGYLEYVRKNKDEPTAYAACKLIIEVIVPDEIDHLNALKAVYRDADGPDKTKDALEAAIRFIKEQNDQLKLDSMRESKSIFKK